jgi:hypothetical protein
MKTENQITCEVCGRFVDEREIEWAGDHTICNDCNSYYSPDELFQKHGISPLPGDFNLAAFQRTRFFGRGLNHHQEVSFQYLDETFEIVVQPAGQFSVIIENQETYFWSLDGAEKFLFDYLKTGETK